jgi:hypothetical protein
MHNMHHHQDTIEVKKDSIEMPEMSHAYSLNLPMTRNGSGTAWLPDASVMYGHGKHSKNWMYMFHSNLFLRYNHQDISNKGSHGGEKFDAPAWFMFMGQRKIRSKGLFHFSTMISLDPFTVGSEGYPLLFQSGETYKGNRLVNRQHPHDLFSELSISYTQMITKNVDIIGYFGYPGEPALGPAAFMHRVSALNNPDAPLSHHWQDATHIDFGVATLGIRFGKFKIEGSSFTGREPDENRYDFDKPKFDSYSFRLSCNPNKQLALQISQAFLKSPEAAEPHEDTKRTTASIIHHLPFKSENTYLSTAIVWGYNQSHLKENSLLIEPTLQLDRTAIYGRYEWVQKDAVELDLNQFVNGEIALFNIQALTLGINRVFLRKAGFNTALSFQGTLYMADKRLDRLYGQYPLAGEVYIRVSPHLTHMHNSSKKTETVHSH